VVEPQTLSNVLRWHADAEHLSEVTAGGFSGNLVPVANALIEELARLKRKVAKS
jgi:hypothetical protein